MKLRHALILKNEELLSYLTRLQKTEKFSYLLSHILAVLFAILPLMPLFWLSINLTTLYLLSIPAVLLSNWHLGFKQGILTTILIAGGIYYLSVFPLSLLNQLLPLFDLLLFSGGAIFTGFLLERARKTDEVKVYKQREKDYAKILLSLQKDNLKAKSEIKARDEFLSIVSHELKTPLTSMLLQMQTALHNISNVSLANFSVQNLLKMLHNAEQQSQRLSRMINDLLNISLITTGRLQLEKEEVDLGQLVKETIERFSEKLEKEGYQLKLEIAENVKGFWDKLRIEQILTNLLSNAIKYGEKKPIEIKVIRKNKEAVLSVTDHGIGIPDNNQEKIFERFERAVTSSEYKGLGVGLYITAQIIRAHAGTIKFISKNGNGTTFIIHLPIDNKPPQAN